MIDIFEQRKTLTVRVKICLLFVEKVLDFKIWHCYLLCKSLNVLNSYENRFLHVK